MWMGKHLSHRLGCYLVLYVLCVLADLIYRDSFQQKVKWGKILVVSDRRGGQPCYELNINKTNIQLQNQTFPG